MHDLPLYRSRLGRSSAASDGEDLRRSSSMFWSVYWVDHPLALLPLGVVMVAVAQLTGSWPNFYRLRWLFILLIFCTTLAWMVFYRKGPPLINLPIIHLSRASLVFGFGTRDEAGRTARDLGAVPVDHQGRGIHVGLSQLAFLSRRLRDHPGVSAGAAVYRFGADRGAGAVLRGYDFNAAVRWSGCGATCRSRFRSSWAPCARPTTWRWRWRRAALDSGDPTSYIDYRLCARDPMFAAS